MLPRPRYIGLALAIVTGFCLLPGVSAGQPRPPGAPPLEGQRITARDGDVIVVENNDRVRIVRRRHAMARVVADESRRLVIVLADWLPAADGTVDQTWRFTVTEGRWPLDARWDGEVVVEDDETMPSRPGSGLVLETPAGLVQFLAGPPSVAGARGAIAVLRYLQFTQGTGNVPFDVAEQQQLSDSPPTGHRATFGPVAGGGSTWGGVQAGVSSGVPGPPRSGPVRGGSNIAPPRKIHHVEPVMPEAGRIARVQGIVIVEATIAEDGSVQNPRVLRSIPLLDQAALDAVRQWRFEPPMLNGQPTQMILTLTVPFRQQ